MNQGLGILIFVGFIAAVLIFAFAMRSLVEKKRSKGAEARIQNIKKGISYVKETYIKDPTVKMAFVYSNNSMCQRSADKVKDAAKNLAKAAVRTAITGRASYRGSEIGNRDYLVGYVNQTYYFFPIYDSSNELSFREDEFFSVNKEEIEKIMIKEKKPVQITLDLKDGSRFGFQLKDKIINELDYTAENELFAEYLRNKAELYQN